MRLAREKKYYAAVPLPLPNEAAEQNWVLAVRTSIIGSTGGEFELMLQRDQRRFCRKIGLRCEATKLKACAARVNDWLARHGGELFLLLPKETRFTRIERNKLSFWWQPPTVPRWQRGGENGLLEGASNSAPSHAGREAAKTGYSKGRIASKRVTRRGE